MPKVDRQTGLVRDLRRLVGDEAVLVEDIAAYLSDEARTSGKIGWAEAVVFPQTADCVRRVVDYCYSTEIPVTPRGGGTGYCGGAIPDGGVVISTERLRSVRSFDPLAWRAEVEAGRTTRQVQQLAQESGLLFPPDPGAAESSHIGGNIATNAGGPHTFKYGVTRRWVTGLEVVLPPGELVRLGGAQRKDVAGYDLIGLLTGSEGTLGIVTAAWLSFIPAPQTRATVVAAYGSVQAGCAAIERIYGFGILASAVDYLDGGAIAPSIGAFPHKLPSGAEFMVLAEVDGSAVEVDRARTELIEALEEDCLATIAPDSSVDTAAIWAWRESVSGAVTTARGHKLSEDIAVPVDRLADAVLGTVEIGRRFGLHACSWGHAGDGNLHSTFMLDAADIADGAPLDAATDALFELAVDLRGTVSGEHGLGILKNGQLRRQWSPYAVELHRGVKQLFDPKNLLNPGKKCA